LTSAALLAQAAPDPGVVAQRAFDQLLNRQYHELFLSFSPELRAELPEAAIPEQAGRKIQALGKPIRTAQPVILKTAENDVVVINAVFATASFDFEFFVTGDGKIGGLFLRPVQQ
jgi:hypothetical protein